MVGEIQTKVLTKEIEDYMRQVVYETAAEKEGLLYMSSSAVKWTTFTVLFPPRRNYPLLR